MSTKSEYEDGVRYLPAQYLSKVHGKTGASTSPTWCVVGDRGVRYRKTKDMEDLDEHYFVRCHALVCGDDVDGQWVRVKNDKFRDDFTIGEKVQKRDLGEEWSWGYVVGTNPLRVTNFLNPKDDGHTWDEVRKTSIDAQPTKDQPLPDKSDPGPFSRRMQGLREAEVARANFVEGLQLRLKKTEADLEDALDREKELKLRLQEKEAELKDALDNADVHGKREDDLNSQLKKKEAQLIELGDALDKAMVHPEKEAELKRLRLYLDTSRVHQSIVDGRPVGRTLATSNFKTFYDERNNGDRRIAYITIADILHDLSVPFRYSMTHERGHHKSVGILMANVAKHLCNFRCLDSPDDIVKVMTILWSTDYALPKMLSVTEESSFMKVTLDLPTAYGVQTFSGEVLNFSTGCTSIPIQWTSPSPDCPPAIRVEHWEKFNARTTEQRPEVCSLLAAALREDDKGPALYAGTGLCIAFNKFLGKARHGAAVSWSNVVWRGGDISPWGFSFFQEMQMSGKWYRAGMPLATSKEESRSDWFIQRSHDKNPTSQLIKYKINLDPVKHCYHANFITRDLGTFGDQEKEIVFAVYSAFKVLSVHVSSTPTDPTTPHIVELEAAVDNKDVSDDVPTALWH